VSQGKDGDASSPTLLEFGLPQKRIPLGDRGGTAEAKPSRRVSSRAPRKQRASPRARGKTERRHITSAWPFGRPSLSVLSLPGWGHTIGSRPSTPLDGREHLFPIFSSRPPVANLAPLHPVATSSVWGFAQPGRCYGGGKGASSVRVMSAVWRTADMSYD